MLFILCWHIQVLELEDIREVTGTAVHRLQETLSSIEAAAQAGHLLTDRTNTLTHNTLRASTGAGVPTATKKGSAGASGGSVPAGSVDVLSRELVKAKLAEADAVRKLRVSARAEVELRQRVLQRDARIAELKEQLDAAGTGKAAGAAAGRFRSVSPTRAAGRRGAGADGGEASGRAGARSAARARPNGGGAAANRAEMDHLNTQLIQARLQVAKKDAQLQQLQGELRAWTVP